MKRTVLRPNPETVRAFIQRGRGKLKANPEKPLGRVVPLAAGSPTGLGHAARQEPRNALQKPRLSPLAQAMAEAWGLAARLRACAMCGFKMKHGQLGVVQGHHIIEREVLDREGIPESLWYDQRNMLPLCAGVGSNRCHENHTHRIKRVPMSVISTHAPLAIEFARETGLDWRLERTYSISE